MDLFVNDTWAVGRFTHERRRSLRSLPRLAARAGTARRLRSGRCLVPADTFAETKLLHVERLRPAPRCRLRSHRRWQDRDQRRTTASSGTTLASPSPAYANSNTHGKAVPTPGTTPTATGSGNLVRKARTPTSPRLEGSLSASIPISTQPLLARGRVCSSSARLRHRSGANWASSTRPKTTCSRRTVSRISPVAR